MRLGVLLPALMLAASLLGGARPTVAARPPSSGLSTLIKEHLAGGASRLAALLLPQILPVFSVVAPCHPGAALRDLVLVQRGQATSALRTVRLPEFTPSFAGGAGLLGACSRFSDTLLAGHQNQAPTRKVVNVVAERFQFFPSEITVDEGTLVELRITSEDTSHGFRLIGPGDIDVEIPKRGRGDIRVTFDAMEPGNYQFECSRVCGAGHSFMRGTLRVRSRTTSR